MSMNRSQFYSYLQILGFSGDTPDVYMHWIQTTERVKNTYLLNYGTLTVIEFLANASIICLTHLKVIPTSF